jgi:hypothetical protein
MPKIRASRIEIRPEIWPALQVEAVIRSMSPKDLVNMLIMAGLSPKAREFMIGQPIATKEPISPQPHNTICGAPTVAGKRKRLADNPNALQAIKDMWKAGERNQAEIARQIGYHRATVFDAIQRMKKAGELSD